MRYQDNIRGEEVFKRNPELFEVNNSFSVMIFGGKGELFFKKIEGVWYESIMSVDRCFGVMRSKFRPLKI